MSTLTTTKKPSRLAALAEEFFIEQQAQQKAAREAAERHAEFKNELKQSLNFYNTVVENTARKFNAAVPASSVYSQLFISSSAEFKYINPYTNEYFFEYNGTKYSIHASLLRRDPVAIAQYTRKHIRKLQDAQHAEEYKKAKTAKEKAQRDFRAAERALKEAEAQFDAANQKIERRAELVEKRLQKKIKSRAAAAAHALA